MIQKTFTATLDVKRGVIETPIVVVRGDTGNVFKLRVQDDGADVDLTGASVVVAFRGPGGAWTQDMETGGVTVSGAEVTFPVFKDSVSEGTNSCDVQIYSEEPGGIPSLVTTAAFTFECRAATVGEDSIRADASLPILLELIRQMSEAADKFPRIDVEAIQHGHRIVITNYDETEYTCDVMDGVSGVYVGSGAMPEGYNVQIDPDGGELPQDYERLGNLPKINGITLLGDKSCGDLGLGKGWRSVTVTTTEDVNLLSVDIDKDAAEMVITYNITKSNDTSAYLWIASRAAIGSNNTVFNRPGPFTTARTQAHLLIAFLRDGKCGSTIYQGIASGMNWFTTTTYTDFRANGKVYFSFGTAADIVAGSTVTIYYR